MIELEDGKVAKVTHYRIAPIVAQMHIQGKVRLVDTKESAADNVRALKEAGVKMDKVSGMGGCTFVQILQPNGDGGDPEVLAEAWAVCRPDEHFNKRLGREIALGRALKQLGK